jgi:hypothetical protein
MTRPWVFVHGAIAIVLGPLVFVHDAHGDRGAQCDTMFNPGLYFYTILLVSGCGDFALARSSPCELGLDVGLSELETRWAAVDYDAD